MPYGTRRQVGVKLALIPGLVFGFRTDVADATSTALGHVNVLSGGTYIAGTVFGINSPKPPVARKFFGTGTKKYESSYVDKDKIDDARTAGWIVKPGKNRRARSTAFSKLVYVDLKIVDAVAAEGSTPAAPAVTVKYAWKMPAYQYAKLTAADKTTLGISDLDADDVKEAMFGANSPRPYRASKTITTTDGVQQTISTFVASNKIDSLSGGWV